MEEKRDEKTLFSDFFASFLAPFVHPSSYQEKKTGQQPILNTFISSCFHRTNVFNYSALLTLAERNDWSKH